MESYLLHKIDRLRSSMVQKAREYNYNFQHPEVLSISRKLDLLIIEFMVRK
ncbi:MAG: Spo0E like sporulation regulatory protein [Paenibacillus sp.]|jgi:hypothetical protein|nr:Spo0E like sporulation regulatory protein [Paenibacillus sp.]